MSGDAILLSKYKKNRPENAFREVVSTREVYGEKWRIFGLKIFRVLWETPESRFGSFAGRLPGPRSFRVFWETHACAFLSLWYQLLPLGLISAYNERGLQCFEDDLSFASQACLVMIQEGFRRVWPSHFHFRLRSLPQFVVTDSIWPYQLHWNSYPGTWQWKESTSSSSFPLRVTGCSVAVLSLKILAFRLRMFSPCSAELLSRSDVFSRSCRKLCKRRAKSSV